MGCKSQFIANHSTGSWKFQDKSDYLNSYEPVRSLSTALWTGCVNDICSWGWCCFFIHFSVEGEKNMNKRHLSVCIENLTAVFGCLKKTFFLSFLSHNSIKLQSSHFFARCWCCLNDTKTRNVTQKHTFVASWFCHMAASEQNRNCFRVYANTMWRSSKFVP